jgi:hypothetical protein
MMEIISAIGTFFGVLLIMLFAIAVTSQGALKGPEAFVLRWTVLSLAVAFSAMVAWLRWRVLQRRKIVVHGRSRDRAETQRADKDGASIFVAR